jgi:hypothetical protein
MFFHFYTSSLFTALHTSSIYIPHPYTLIIKLVIFFKIMNKQCLSGQLVQYKI